VKKVRVIPALAVILAISVALLEFFAPASAHARTQDAAAVPKVEIFAPGIISGPANDGSPTFSPDGSTLLFTRSATHWTVILESHLVRGTWSTPEVAAFSGEWPDSSPAWSPDGKYVVFQSTRPKDVASAPTASGGAQSALVSNLWRVDRTASGWSAPVRLPDAVNISGSIWKPSIAASGNLYITVIGPGAAKSIYMSELKNGEYQQAKLLPFSDGAKLDVDPEVAPDESFLVFSSGGRIEGDPHERLFLVKRKGGEWGTPTLIRYQDDVTKYGASTDNEPKLGRDGYTLYFSSDRTPPTHFPRTHAQAEADIERLNQWDNSNSNVWFISLKNLL
jgi:dipeptidyl aminopeptidase/acylaminoacyl peptidase